MRVEIKLDPEETILLTKQDYDSMVEACKQPAKPNAALVRAAQQYKERFDETKTQDS